MKTTFTVLLAVLLPFLAFGESPKDSQYVPKNLRKNPRPTVVDAKTPLLQPPPMMTVTNPLKPEWLKPPAEPFTLGPGDKLEIEILDELNAKQGVDNSSRQIVPVGPDGKIYFSILPGIDVWGLTLTQTKELLEKEFSKFLRDKPQIGVTLREVQSKRVWLLGRFAAPGIYSNAVPMTLLEAVSMAGGAMTLAGATGGAGIQQIAGADNSEEIADLKRAFVVRQGEFIPVDFERLLKQGDLSQNIYLQSDDFVYLPPARAREIYVIGAVNQPHAVPFQEGMTLVGAIANAGGTFKDSYLSHVAVVRGSLSNPQVAIVDYKEIIKGHAPDVPLEAHDIVHVPLKPYRWINRYVQLIANTFVTTVAINEGAHAVNENIRPTQIVVPLGSTITIGQGTSIQAR